MNIKLCCLLLIGLIFISFLNAITEVVADVPDLNIFQEDFDYFQKTLRESHPDIYTNLPEPEFNHQVNLMLKELATETDTLHFLAKLKQFSHLLGDGHTGPFYYKEETLFYPIIVCWFEEGWYISYISKEFAEYVGSKIVSINGKEADEFMSILMTLCKGENIYWFRETVSDVLRYSSNLKLLDLAAEDKALHLVVEKVEEKKELILKEVERCNYINVPFKGITQYQNVPYWGKALPSDDIYYLQFNKFRDTTSDNPEEEFYNWKSFLIQSFNCIDSLKINNLVIDLRNNSGGNSKMGDILLSFCKLPDSLATFTCDVCISELMLKNYNKELEEVKKMLEEGLNREIEDFTMPYVIKQVDEGIRWITTEGYINQQIGTLGQNLIMPPLFEGRIILLTGYGTFSSAVMFATICQDNGLATLYGTPTGGKPSCYGDILSLALPNTGILCGVSYKYFRRPDYTRDPSDSLYPDVWIKINPEDYFSGKDTVWGKVREDIQNKAVPEPREL
jgi:hypothetical protein